MLEKTGRWDGKGSGEIERENLLVFAEEQKIKAAVTWGQLICPFW